MKRLVLVLGLAVTLTHPSVSSTVVSAVAPAWATLPLPEEHCPEACSRQGVRVSPE